jgi:signal transduction histidine kinase
MRNTGPEFRYALAILAAVAALLLRGLLTPLLGFANPYHTIWLAVVFSAWYCGLGPSIVTTLLGTVGVWYWFLPPPHSWIIQGSADVYGIVGFLVFSSAIIALGESNRRGFAAQSQAEETIKEQELSARLLKLQDEERRRIARELHDGVGQLLAAMSMNASRIEQEKSNLSPDTAQCAEENSKLIQQASVDIRTISYLFHPPLLDELGLHSALKWYVEGFAERSKIAAELQCAMDGDRLPEDYELCLFRITQECLTNIHLHSGSSTAVVRLMRSPVEIKLEVSDRGKGLNQETKSKIASGETAGVGLRGMRERLKQLGGSLEIQSNGRGTTVTATVPFEEAARSAVTASSNNGRESHPELSKTMGDLSNTAVLQPAPDGKAPSQTAKA